MDGRFDWEIYRALPVVGILRGFDDAAVRRSVAAAASAGLRNVEIAMNGDGAEAQIALLRRDLGAEMNVGAGTVMTLDDLRRARDAGAEFIVTPVVNEPVIRACVEADVPVIPGALTPTEVAAAWAAGASLVKVFPASRLGPAYLRDLRGPLDGVRLMPVGGVTPDDLPAYLAAGADGVGVGSTLFHRDRVAADDRGWIRGQMERYARAVAAARA